MRVFLRMIYGLGIALLVVATIEPEAVIVGATWWAMGFISLGALGFTPQGDTDG